MPPRVNTKGQELEASRRAVCKIIKAINIKIVRTLFVSVCILTSVEVSAQTVSGKLTDENSYLLPYDNVVLLSLPDSEFVSGTTSDDKVNFVPKDLSY